MNHRAKFFTVLAVVLLVPTLSLRAQQPQPGAQPQQPTAKDIAKEANRPAPEKSASDPIERIKEEGLNHSQVMQSLSYLTDVIGPRLTASPNMRRANEWTRNKLEEWGLYDAHLEAWGPFGRGWSLRRFSIQVVEPQCIPLIGFPKAWSPSTAGPIVAEVVHFNARSESDFEKYKGKLKGAIVLASPIQSVSARFEPLATRLTDKELLDLANAAEPNSRFRRRPPAPTGPTAGGGEAQPGPRRQLSPEQRAAMELARKRAEFLQSEGVAVMIDPSAQGDGGTLFIAAASIPGAAPAFAPGSVPGRRVSPWDKDAPKIIPQVTLAKEHYNRLVRMLEAGEKVKMEVDLAVAYQDDDLMGYNTIAEIPGSDLKDEIVMLGAHMDSWHSGTGATDNGAGCAVAMEVMRMIQTLQLKPKRTIRIGLWSGEEQGLLGSRAYVADHFGQLGDGSMSSFFAAMRAGGDLPKLKTKPDYEKFSAYFNLDNGTGKIRGVYLQGNEAVRPLFRDWLVPFRDMGAATLTIANTGGTDHQSFDVIGLPGFQFIQDVVEYNSRTHHSNQDVFDRIQADDLKQAAVIMTAFVYNTAMRDEKLPRKPAPPR